MPKRGRVRKKKRTQAPAVASTNSFGAPDSATGALQTDEKTPKSLVIRRGKGHSQVVADLVQDLRQLLLPYTALHFQEDAGNRKLSVAQYIQHLALPMGITHIWQLSVSQPRKNKEGEHQKDNPATSPDIHQNLNIQLIRTPVGPTLHFRVHSFSLIKGVQRVQKRPISLNNSLREHPPVVVTHNFGDHTAPPHIKLLRITFQNLFPALNVATVPLSACKRVVLFNLIDEEDDVEGNGLEEDADGEGEESIAENNKKNKKRKSATNAIKVEATSSRKKQLIHVRHYAIKATPTGVHRRVRRLVNITKKIPNLSKCDDIADYLDGYVSEGGGSDSEPEEDTAPILPASVTGKPTQSALKLVELGPRLTLELIKVEKSVAGSGTTNPVLYHAFVEKSAEEAEELKKKHERAAELKKQRRAQQEANVARKKAEKEAKREARQLKRKEREVEDDDDEGDDVEPMNDEDYRED